MRGLNSEQRWGRSVAFVAVHLAAAAAAGIT